MDKLKKLITLLQQNARMPLKALAENYLITGGFFKNCPSGEGRIIEGYEVKH